MCADLLHPRANARIFDSIYGLIAFDKTPVDDLVQMMLSRDCSPAQLAARGRTAVTQALAHALGAYTRANEDNAYRCFVAAVMKPRSALWVAFLRGMLSDELEYIEQVEIALRTAQDMFTPDEWDRVTADAAAELAGLNQTVRS